MGYLETTVDASGDVGQLSRPIGPNFGYVFIGVPSEECGQFNTAHTKRLAVLQYCTHVVSAYGINEIVHGLGSAQPHITTLQTIISPIPFFQATMPPQSTGAWTLANHSDQTIEVTNSTRVADNNWIRGNPTNITGIEIADYTEFARDDGFWKADGTTNKYTTDGLHETTFANKQYVISSSLFPLSSGSLPLLLPTVDTAIFMSFNV
jgi:hypothetical protein